MFLIRYSSYIISTFATPKNQVKIIKSTPTRMTAFLNLRVGSNEMQSLVKPILRIGSILASYIFRTFEYNKYEIRNKSYTRRHRT